MDGKIDRRQFLAASAGGAGAMLFGGQLSNAIADNGTAWPPELPEVKIHRVYVGATDRIYLSRRSAEIDMYERHLSRLERKLSGVKFVGGEHVYSPDAAAKVAAELGKADGVLIFHLCFNARGMVKQLVDAGLPTVLFRPPLSGHDWMYFTGWQQAGLKVLPLSCSKLERLDRAVRLLSVPARMRQSRVVLVGDPQGTKAACSAEKVNEKIGATVIPFDLSKFRAVYKSIGDEPAQALANTWIRQAKKVAEPSKQDIVKACRVYLTMKEILSRQKARAITINCLGQFPLRELGHPCLGFSRLNDQGLVGACEADMDSTLTMLIFGYAFGVPGFISDPDVDMSRNSLIHFHCTSALRMDGPEGRPLPYTIRNHADSGTGAALQVEHRVGQTVTCAKLVNLDTMLVSTGRTVTGRAYDEVACRTQFETEVADARKMFRNWGCGLLEGGMMTLLHRDVFYGDYLDDIKDLAVLMGLRVVEEGQCANATDAV